MTGPQTPRGRQVKGWRGEAAVKGIYEGRGHLVFDLSPSLPGMDLLVLTPDEPSGVWYAEAVLEVKTRPWGRLSSPARQSAASAADRLSRLRPAVKHLVWAPNGRSGEWEVRKVRIDPRSGSAQTMGVPYSGVFKGPVHGLRGAPDTPPTRVGPAPEGTVGWDEE